MTFPIYGKNKKNVPNHQPALQPSQLREVAERKTANMSLSETGAAVNSLLNHHCPHQK
jgi:hypothetical protein